MRITNVARKQAAKIEPAFAAGRLGAVVVRRKIRAIVNVIERPDPSRQESPARASLLLFDAIARFGICQPDSACCTSEAPASVRVHRGTAVRAEPLASHALDTLDKGSLLCEHVHYSSRRSLLWRSRRKRRSRQRPSH
jgi:hypothetical protein